MSPEWSEQHRIQDGTEQALFSTVPSFSWVQTSVRFPEDFRGARAIESGTIVNARRWPGSLAAVAAMLRCKTSVGRLYGCEPVHHNSDGDAVRVLYRIEQELLSVATGNEEVSRLPYVASKGRSE